METSTTMAVKKKKWSKKKKKKKRPHHIIRTQELSNAVCAAREKENNNVQLERFLVIVLKCAACPRECSCPSANWPKRDGMGCRLRCVRCVSVARSVHDVRFSRINIPKTSYYVFTGRSYTDMYKHVYSTPCMCMYGILTQPSWRRETKEWRREREHKRKELEQPCRMIITTTTSSETKKNAKDH